MGGVSAVLQPAMSLLGNRGRLIRLEPLN
jgi:hypothetical protein